jgi:hypothetical protein
MRFSSFAQHALFYENGSVKSDAREARQRATTAGRLQTVRLLRAPDKMPVAALRILAAAILSGDSIRFFTETKE